MIIKLEWPDAKLAPNRANGKHWGGVAAIKAKAKAYAYVLAKNASYGQEFNPTKKYALRITFLAPDARRRDLDGCLSSLKSALDGIAAAMVVDDRHFCPITIDYKVATKPGNVLVEVLA